jgi:biotin carboxyl carrier protein
MSNNVVEVVTPLPGVFYRRPSPEEPVYVEEGAGVTAGEVIGLVEVMKNFTAVVCEVSGTLERFLVDDEGVVAPGQPLAEVAVQGD